MERKRLNIATINNDTQNNQQDYFSQNLNENFHNRQTYPNDNANMDDNYYTDRNFIGDYFDLFPSMPFFNGLDSYSLPKIKNPFTQKIPLKTLKDEDYIYVNSKQYLRILKRREKRKKLYEIIQIDIHCDKGRKYHHESRHKHAMNRERGKGGRFLSKKTQEEINNKEDNNVNSIKRKGNEVLKGNSD